MGYTTYCMLTELQFCHLCNVLLSLPPCENLSPLIIMLPNCSCDWRKSTGTCHCPVSLSNIWHRPSSTNWVTFCLPCLIPEVHGFLTLLYHGGHNDGTGNNGTCIWIEKRKAWVMMPSNLWAAAMHALLYLIWRTQVMASFCLKVLLVTWPYHQAGVITFFVCCPLCGVDHLCGLHAACVPTEILEWEGMGK